MPIIARLRERKGEREPLWMMRFAPICNKSCYPSTCKDYKDTSSKRMVSFMAWAQVPLVLVLPVVLVLVLVLVLTLVCFCHSLSKLKWVYYYVGKVLYRAQRPRMLLTMIVTITIMRMRLLPLLMCLRHQATMVTSSESEAVDESTTRHRPNLQEEGPPTPPGRSITDLCHHNVVIYIPIYNSCFLWYKTKYKIVCSGNGDFRYHSKWTRVIRLVIASIRFHSTYSHSIR